VAAVALGFAAALCWGLADFLGGVLTRWLTLATVLVVSELTGVAAIAIVVAVAGVEVPSGGDLTPALGAGVSQIVGIAALYRALAVGTMSVISPISATGAAALPVIVGIATGERPGALQAAGMLAGLLGVVLATRSAGLATAPSREARVLGAVAALGFGGFYVGMGEAVDSADPFGALLVARITACVALAAALVALRPRLGVGRPDLAPLAAIGLLDVGANSWFTLGADTGLLSVVAVLASLYPVATVVLARALLGERLGSVQGVGVAIALTGVALIAAG
jgi:drug/metabolite transporter (DMT)-like permease